VELLAWLEFFYEQYKEIEKNDSQIFALKEVIAKLNKKQEQIYQNRIEVNPKDY